MQQVAMKQNVSVRATSLARRAAPRPSFLVRSEKGDGVVNRDNSGKMNIYPTIQRPVFESSESASQGLGGIQGVAIVAAVIGVVGLATATLVVPGSTGDTLASLGASYSGDSLSVIAGRIAASL